MIICDSLSRARGRYSRPHRDAPSNASPGYGNSSGAADLGDGDSLAFNDLVSTPRRQPFTPARNQFDAENGFGYSLAAGGGVSFGSRLVPRCRHAHAQPLRWRFHFFDSFSAAALQGIGV
jgi:hypothetical protein